MKHHTMSGRRTLVALCAGVCLIFAAGVTGVGASLILTDLSRADATASANHKVRSLLLVHGVRFDSKTGQLDEGSKAILDDAAEFLKANPDVIVVVVAHSEEDPDRDRALSPTQAHIIASYLERRGVPAGRFMFGQAATRSLQMAER